jgi:hypothetical protein
MDAAIVASRHSPEPHLRLEFLVQTQCKFTVAISLVNVVTNASQSRKVNEIGEQPQHESGKRR